MSEAPAAGADLAQWLAWQEGLNPRGIELGLKRVRQVAEAMDPADGLKRPADWVITVAGTNGKGSVVALLEALLSAQGLAVACYTSPHLVRYNERVRVAGREVEDAELVRAFRRVERFRHGVPLTYFEFGTLAALDLIGRHAVDVAVLEVGLGGRLDAVNICQPDVAVVTTVDLDHQDWLGPDREANGREKAGVFRQRRPAVCGDPDPPHSLLEWGRQLGTRLAVQGRDFRAQEADSGWDWQGRYCTLTGLPEPGLAGPHQRVNAATALAALEALKLFPTADEAARALVAARLPGRQQWLPGPPPVLLDVAHNPQAARALAAGLAADPVPGRTLAVLGMLADKDLSAWVQPLVEQVDGWFCAGLDGPRGRSGADLAAALAPQVPAPVQPAADLPAALAAARAAARPGDRLLVTGSFLTVGAALEVLTASAVEAG